MKKPTAPQADLVLPALNNNKLVFRRLLWFADAYFMQNLKNVLTIILMSIIIIKNVS